MSENIVPLISIVGTTASGKTDVALALADSVMGQSEMPFNGVTLISADSRQVYEGLPVLTGADVPTKFIQKSADSFDTYPYFKHVDAPITLHGISIVKPEDPWSLGRFIPWAKRLISDAQRANLLPILLGGTGLYHRMALRSDPAIFTPQNISLRQWASSVDVATLQNRLVEMDRIRFEQMNDSDRYNPRRLLRAIEQAEHVKKYAPIQPNEDASQVLRKWYGVTAENDVLQNRIARRVEFRIAHGALEEVKSVENIQMLHPELPIFSTLGFQLCAAFNAREIPLNELIERWTRQEVQYAKRQITWWKSHSEINWLDTTSKHWLQDAVDRIISDLKTS